jgi:hypothetical protein
MVDTIRGWNENATCSDCGAKGTLFKHWGPLVPNGKPMQLCSLCWMQRTAYYKHHGVAKPASGCKHPKVTPEFSSTLAALSTVEQIRERWPRFDGICPDCSDHVIVYASYEHYVAGDW